MRRMHERVVCVATWSSYRGMHGEVTQVSPFCMVLFDGESAPVRVGEREVIGEQESAPHLGGAE